MKILHFSKYYPPYFGGIETVAYDIVEGVNENNISCDVLCFNSNLFSETEVKNKYRVFRMGRLFEIFSTPISLSVILKFISIAKNYDIIHIHHPNPLATFCLLIAKNVIKDKKIIVHWHSDIIKQKKMKIFFAPFQHYMLKRADLIITTSEPYRLSSECLRQFLPKTKTVPIGVVSLVNKVDFQHVKLIKKK
ncbi:glycosyl transferase family 1, partial [Escherichia coli]|nr:glycosyl transferase family 1 [Escherichia coli]